MRGTKFLMGILCIIVWNINAQQDNNWYFGRMAGLNFSNGRPVAIKNSKMTTMEGSAAISNQNGDLLFYTNGVYVWNKNNQLMPHGNDLLGDVSTTQSAVIIQKPGQKNRYYIFAADDAGGPNGLTFSEVDMTADGGKGDVVSKNNSLIAPITEKIAAVQHINGTDVWITTHQWGGNAFYSYKITAEGVNTTPVVSHAGLVIEGADNSGHYAGWMNFSPNGKRLAAAHGLLAAELFDFDAATGIVSNAVIVKSPAECYGVEFSPNSKLLYLSSDNKIYQYQVNATNVEQSQVEVGTIDVASSMKLGPDSKIYVVHKYLAKNLSVINNPDVIGKGCNLAYEAVDLGGKETFVGLPNFITTPFYVLDIKMSSDCSDTAVSFSATTTLDSESVHWDFGDGNTSNNLNVTHTYAKTGTYVVKAKAKRGAFFRYYTKTITVLKAPVATQPANMITCGSEENAAVFNLRDQDAAILGTQPVANYLVSYHASLSDAEAGINPLPDNYTAVESLQTLYARVFRDVGICYAVTSFTVAVAPKPVIDMADSYGYCEGSSVILSAPVGMDSYLWSTGETTRTIQVDKAGSYTLSVTKKTGTTICETTKTITVHESYKPVIKEILINEWTSNSNTITVITEGVGNYEYSIDGSNFQDSNVFNELAPGQYKVIVREKDGCGFAEDKVVLLAYPKYFTPNGDGFHDTWQVDYAHYDPKMIVYIYDRYGKLLTSFKGNTPGWDGTFNGNKLPATDYWFVVQRSDGREYKGHFAMMR